MIFGDVRSNCYTFLKHFDFFSAVKDDTHKSFIPPCRIEPRDESNGKIFWGNYIYLLEFSYDIRWCKVNLLHFFDTFGIFSLRWRVKRTTLLYPHVGHGPGMNRTEKVHQVTTCISSIFRMILGDVRSNCYTFLTHIWNFPPTMEGETHNSFIPPYRTSPRHESNWKSLWGIYMYLLDFSYDIRWCKIKLLHFFDNFGIFPLRWRVTRTSVLYPRIGHGPGMNRTEKVYEVTTFISSIFRMIFGDVRPNCYTFLTHLDFFSAVEDDTYKSFIPPCRIWPRDESKGKVSEATTFISSSFRMIFGDVRSNCYTFLTHLE